MLWQCFELCLVFVIDVFVGFCDGSVDVVFLWEVVEFGVQFGVDWGVIWFYDEVLVVVVFCDYFFVVFDSNEVVGSVELVVENVLFGQDGEMVEFVVVGVGVVQMFQLFV